MVAIKLLNEWYGYDKGVTADLKKYNGDDLNFPYSRGGNNRYHEFMLSETLYKKIKRDYPSESRREAALHYFAESDGFTDQDYIEWFAKHEKESKEACILYNWRTFNAIVLNPDFGSEYTFRHLLSDFFSIKKKRDDRILRIIELNEFIHRADDNQTLEDFLLTDSSYTDKCKNLILKKYSSTSEELYSSFIPQFLHFGSKVNMKTRTLLLELTKEEFLKVVDYKKNPYYDIGRKDTYTLEYAKTFIKAALGEIETVEFEELDSLAVSNQIYMRIMSAPRSYWETLQHKHKLDSVLEEIQAELRRCSLGSVSFKRNFAHLLSTGALDSLTPEEIIAVVIGYEKSHRWSETPKGKSTLEVITELVQAKKLNAEFIAKLIAHIIINDKHPVSVELEFDWDSVKEMPVEWAYETLPQSKSKKTLQHPAIFKKFS